MLEFQSERKVFIHEYSSQMYGTKTYYFSKIVLEVPLLLLLPLVELCITFWGIGYRNGAFMKFYIVNQMSVQAGTSLGYLLSSLFEDTASVIHVGPSVFGMSILFAGFVINLG